MKIKEQITNSTTTSATKWLVVDDNREFLSFLQTMLGAVSDAEICCYDSPAAALRAFTAAPESFALVLSDFDMPGANGDVLLRNLRLISPNLKAILMTGNSGISTLDALEFGFDALLHKPFSISALLTALSMVQEQAPELAAA